MAFSFNQFNKERQFTFDVSVINKAHPVVEDRYISLEQLYKQDKDPDKVYQFHGCYINTKSEFAPEAPVIALDTIYVNLPQFQLADIKSMMADKNAVRAINGGYAGFQIRTYTKEVEGKKKPQVYYSAKWCDFDPEDAFDSDDDDEM